jgi:hypothetical protein
MGVSSGREPSVSPNGFVSHADDFGFDQPVGQFGQRRQMQVGEQDQAGPQITILGRLRFFDFHNEAGLAPHLGSLLHDTGPGLHVLPICNGAALAGPGFDQYLMTRLPERKDPAGHEPDARLVILNLFRDSDDHARILILATPPGSKSNSPGV